MVKRYTKLEYKVAELMREQMIPNVPYQCDWPPPNDELKELLHDAREIVELVAKEENWSER